MPSASGTVTDLAVAHSSILIENDPNTAYPETSFAVFSIKAHDTSAVRRRSISRWDMSTGALDPTGVVVVSNAVLSINVTTAPGVSRDGQIKRYDSEASLAAVTWNNAGSLRDGVASPLITVSGMGVVTTHTISGSAALNSLVEDAVNNRGRVLTTITQFINDTAAFVDFTQANNSAMLLSFDWVVPAAGGGGGNGVSAVSRHGRVSRVSRK